MSADTIYALSSGRLPAAIAVVRVSGPQAGAALEALIGRVPEPRRATLARIRDPLGGDIIDEALVLWFPGPHSETGEDVAELQLHGSRAVVEGVFAALARIEGLRPAEPGEFTRRAFTHGRMDLTQVEGLADLLAAETQAQRRQAIGHLDGVLARQVEAWRQTLIRALALIEAEIDFPDEGDVAGDHITPALAAAAQVATEIAAALDDGRRGERLRDGMVVVIAGPPNVGKSSLLNWFADRDVAIVSPQAGTTRDAVEVHLDLQGYPVTLIDTAGLRDSDDPIEQEGMRRAREKAAAADLILWVVDDDEKGGGMPAVEASLWRVRNKIDVMKPQSIYHGIHPYFEVSVHTEIGLQRLLAKVAECAAGDSATGDVSLVTRSRHRSALARCHAILTESQREAAPPAEIASDTVRRASRAIESVSGRVDVDHILDVVFRDFCIGK